ncbi:ATP-binding protein [Aliikangiella sp. IMCC44359]|uniref:ATP-binding protein n=1 Tax=Aliikangiella sp. IMCC44359 TaxID=3459125 RepID=UPI00403B2DB8
MFKQAITTLILLINSQHALAFSNKDSIPFFYSSEHHHSKQLQKTNIKKMYQDHQGYIWIATITGLVKYDGNTFKTYHPNQGTNNSISDRFIRDIYESKNKTLYISSRLSGLMQYEPNTDSFKDYVDTPNQKFAHTVNHITEDQQGRIWLNSLGTNILFNPSQNTYKMFDNKGASLHIKIANNIPHFYYSGSDFRGLCKIENESQVCIKKMLIDFIIQNTSSTDEIWIGTVDQGLNLYNAKTNSWKNYLPDTQFASGIFYNGHDILYTTKENKLGLFDTQTKVAHDLEKDRLTPLLEKTPHGDIELRLKDASGNIWATSNKQLIRIRYSNFLREIELSKDKNLRLYNIVEGSDNNLWIGSNKKGLIRYNLITKKIASFKPSKFKSFDATALINGPNNSLFIGSSHGVFRYFINSKKWVQYKVKPRGYIEGIALTSNQYLLAGSDKLHRININTEEVTSYEASSGLFDNFISHIEPLKNNNFYLSGGPASNMVIYNSDTNSSIRLKDKNYSLLNSHNSIRDSALTNKGELWINAVSKEIRKVTFSLTGNDNKFETFQIHHNNEIINILSITDDHQGNLWLGTNIGLVYFDTVSKEYQVYSDDDGYPSQGVNSRSILTAKNGNIYFGAMGSIIEVNPSKITQGTSSPNIVITDVIINDQTQLTKANYQLQPTDQSITFKFSSLDFYNTKGIEYRYKLEGFDADWRYTKNSNAHYTNLSPNTYQFIVEGTNARGVWSKHSASVKVTVLPSIWQTPFAYFLYFSSLIGLIYGLLFIRTKRLKSQAKSLEKEVSQRTAQVKQLLDRKNTLFSHISHELRTPLTLILGPLNKALKESSRKNEKEITKNLNIALNNSNRLTHIVDQLLSLSKTSAVEQDKKVVRNLYAIVQYITTSIDSYAIENKVEVIVNVDKNIFIKVIENSLESIFLNLIVNAIKYAADGGWVKIYSSCKNNSVRICVEDNGPGIAKNKQSLIFKRFSQIDESHDGLGIGLALVKELLEVQSGSISLDSEHGKGAIFTIELPAYIPEDNTLTSTDERLTPMTTEQINSQLSLSTEYYHLRESNILNQNLSNISFNRKSSKLRVLIVEDNLEMCNYLFDLLSKDYSCAIAYDGNQGLNVAINELPDLIISDVMMPEMNGFQLTQELRNHSLTAHIPILLLTAQNTDHVRIDAYKHHPDDFMIKPFLDDELLIRIESIFAVREILKQAKFRDLKSEQSYFLKNSKLDNAPTMNKIESSAFNPEDKNINKIFLNKFNDILENNFNDKNLTLDDLASMLNMSRRSLQRKVKIATGVSPITYLRTFRLEKSAQLMEAGHTSIKYIQAEIGMSNNARFYEYFREYTGKTPNEYISDFFEIKMS